MAFLLVHLLQFTYNVLECVHLRVLLWGGKEDSIVCDRCRWYSCFIWHCNHSSELGNAIRTIIFIPSSLNSDYEEDHSETKGIECASLISWVLDDNMQYLRHGWWLVEQRHWYVCVQVFFFFFFDIWALLFQFNLFSLAVLKLKHRPPIRKFCVEGCQVVVVLFPIAVVERSR